MSDINLREGNISLILDSYEDLFSDFDPRDYSQKALSDDFLIECKKASKDKEESVELRLLVPKNKKDNKEEIVIIKRLKTHFQKHFNEKKDEVFKIKREGIIWFLVGVVLMFSSVYLHRLNSMNYFITFFAIMFEPASWFMFWEGLGKIFIESKKKKPDYNFYFKMSKAKVSFLEY